jgi:hypothetical protein
MRAVVVAALKAQRLLELLQLVELVVVVMVLLAQHHLQRAVLT